MEEFSKGLNEEMILIIGFGALARLRKSVSGGRAFKMEELSKDYNKELVGFGALSSLRKSGSGGRASKMEEFAKDVTRK